MKPLPPDDATFTPSDDEAPAPLSTSEIRSLLKALITRSEDPVEMLKQLIIDMQEQRVQVEKQVKTATAYELRLKEELERDPMSTYPNQWELQKAAADGLRATLRNLENTLEEARRMARLLVPGKPRSRHMRSTRSTYDAFDHMARKMEQEEAEAQAKRAEEARRSPPVSEAPAPFDVNDALAALKNTMATEDASSRSSDVSLEDEAVSVDASSEDVIITWEDYL